MGASFVPWGLESVCLRKGWGTEAVDTPSLPGPWSKRAGLTPASSARKPTLNMSDHQRASAARLGWSGWAHLQPGGKQLRQEVLESGSDMDVDRPGRVPAAWLHSDE